MALCGRTMFIGIDGRAGSGKSTLARWLEQEVAGAIVVAVDDFSGPRMAEWDWLRFRAQVLDPLSRGQAARYQRWDWDGDVGAEWRDVEPGGPVIVEGVSSTRDEVGVPWDARIWVDTPREICLARGVERDGETMRKQWTDVWIPSEDAYIATQTPDLRADIVISGIGHA